MAEVVVVTEVEAAEQAIVVHDAVACACEQAELDPVAAAELCLDGLGHREDDVLGLHSVT